MHSALFHGRSAALLLAVSLAVWLSGCASGLSKEECSVVDWRAVGYEDGIRGLSQTRISAHRQACAKHGVALELDAYRQGWREGVARYCQPANGYRQGRRGAAYQGVCSGPLENGFMQAYRSGRELYTQEKTVQRLDRDLGSAYRRLDDLETIIRDTGIELVAPGLTPTHRIILLDELRKLEAEHRELREYRIPDLEQQLATQRAGLAQLRADHRY